MTHGELVGRLEAFEADLAQFISDVTSWNDNSPHAAGNIIDTESERLALAELRKVIAKVKAGSREASIKGVLAHMTNAVYWDHARPI